MSEQPTVVESTRWRWAVVAVVVALVAVVTIWMLVSPRDAQPSAFASTPSPTPSEAVGFPTPVPTQPTEFETPAPGETEVVEKPPTEEVTPLDETAEFVGEVEVDVVEIETVEFEGRLPGEQDGPGLLVTVRIANGGAEDLDTAGAIVNLTYGGDDLLPAPTVTDDAGRLWPATIAAGETAEAVFAFATPLSTEGDIRVAVDLLADEPDVVFVGPRP